MIDRRRTIALLGVAAVPLAWGTPRRTALAAAAGLEVSAWASSAHARIRLIDAGVLPGGDGGRLAGLQIELDPTYLTYWRSPGDAGVPPMVDTAGSANLGALALRFPAPGQFDEGGAQAFGYRDGVIFPMVVTPTDPAQPVDLQVALAFAICASQCLPAAGTMRLRLDRVGSSPEAALVRDAMARVPVLQAVGQHGALTIASVASGPGPGAATVDIRVADGGAPPILFVETPDPWFVAADAATPTGAGRYAVALRVLAGPPGPARVPVRLTLVTPAHANDVATDLDLALAKP